MADEPEGGSGNTDEEKAAAAAAAAIAKAAGEKTLTQAQVDKIVQERLAKTKKQLDDQQKLLDDYKSNKTLSEEQQNQLQEQLSSMQRAVLSKEELTAKEKKELEKALTTKNKELEIERDKWRKQYESSTVERAIFDETREIGFDPQQFIDLLSPRTRLITEVVDGKPTGRYLPTVQFNGLDADGKSVPMELSVKDTVKEMQKMTDKYGNLFKSGLNSGLGGKNDGGTGGKGVKDADIKTHDDYMKNRQAIKDQLIKDS